MWLRADRACRVPAGRSRACAGIAHRRVHVVPVGRHRRGSRAARASGDTALKSIVRGEIFLFGYRRVDNVIEIYYKDRNEIHPDCVLRSNTALRASCSFISAFFPRFLPGLAVGLRGFRAPRRGRRPSPAAPALAPRSRSARRRSRTGPVTSDPMAILRGLSIAVRLLLARRKRYTESRAAAHEPLKTKL